MSYEKQTPQQSPYEGSAFGNAVIRIAQERDHWQHEATHDHLTGLLNRRGFQTSLKELFAAHVDPENLGIVNIDLNKFKKVNDTLSHNKGDEILAKTGTFLRDHLRESDLVAHNIAGRMGGDEFVALVDLSARKHNQHLTVEERRQALSDRLHAQYAQMVSAEEPGLVRLGFGLSAGVVMYEPGETIEQWMQRADDAMYAQKQTHGGSR